jgi:hypothetical protein
MEMDVDDLNNNVMVSGEFNEWYPEFMKRGQDPLTMQLLYYYEKKVLSGFKYRYNFIVNGKIVVDK